MGRRDAFIISILTFITAVAWIAFDVYHASVESTIPTEVESQLAPITPKFDTSVIEKVKKRQNVEPLDSGSIKVVVPTQTPSSSPAAAILSISPTPRPELGANAGLGQTATQSGGL